MNVVHRRTSSIWIDVEKPARKADTAYSRMLQVSTRAAAQQVGQVAAQQAKNAAGKRGNVKQPAHPFLKLRPSRLRAGQFGNRRRQDELGHQQLVDVEGKADGRQDDDQPLGRRQRRSSRGWVGWGPP